jgi:predicted transcriptional regulator
MKVLLSIKPEYAEKILNGEKKYEFRKRLFDHTSISKVIIYASSPISKIIGEFEVDYVLSLNIGELWGKTMRYSGVDKEFYDRYFSGKDIGHAIRVKKVKRYKRSLCLHDYGIQQAPQSFAYIRKTTKP